MPLHSLDAGCGERRKRAADLRPSKFVFPGSSRTGHIVSMQHPHEQAIKKANLRPFEFYCWRHAFATRCVMAGMNKFSLCQLAGHSALAVTEKYYVHVTAPHVASGFERFVQYSERGTAEGFATHSLTRARRYRESMCTTASAF